MVIRNSICNLSKYSIKNDEILSPVLSEKRISEIKSIFTSSKAHKSQRSVNTAESPKNLLRSKSFNNSTHYIRAEEYGSLSKSYRRSHSVCLARNWVPSTPIGSGISSKQFGENFSKAKYGISTIANLETLDFGKNLKSELFKPNVLRNSNFNIEELKVLDTSKSVNVSNNVADGELNKLLSKEGIIIEDRRQMVDQMFEMSENSNNGMKNESELTKIYMENGSLRLYSENNHYVYQNSNTNAHQTMGTNIDQNSHSNKGDSDMVAHEYTNMLKENKDNITDVNNSIDTNRNNNLLINRDGLESDGKLYKKISKENNRENKKFNKDGSGNEVKRYRINSKNFWRRIRLGAFTPIVFGLDSASLSALTIKGRSKTDVSELSETSDPELSESKVFLKLLDKIEKLVKIKREKVLELHKKYGTKVLGDVTLAKLFSGLKDVPAMVTETSELDPIKGIKFRGLTVDEMLRKLPGKHEDCPYTESVLWYLLTGEIPEAEDVKDLSYELYTRSEVPKHVFEVMDSMPIDSHPLTQYVTAVSALQTESVFRRAYLEKTYQKDTCWKLALEDCLNLVAKNVVLVGYIYRRSFLDPKTRPEDVKYNSKLDYAANLGHFLGDSSELFSDLMRLYLALHSDHEGGNVSAHASHLVGSALADPYFCLASALCGLSGPLHGMANQECLVWIKRMLKKLGPDTEITLERVKKYAEDTMAAGQVIPGYGHAVLKVTDPRHTAFVRFARTHFPNDPMVKLLDICLEAIPQVLTASGKVRNPNPNVDCSTGVLLSHFNIDQPQVFTVFFGLSRSLGILSQLVWARALRYPIERPKSLTLDTVEKMCESPDTLIVLLLCKCKIESVSLNGNGGGYRKEAWKDGVRMPLGYVGDKDINSKAFGLYNSNKEYLDNKYCEDVYKRVRFPTRCVKIGKVTIGGNNPIALQTMTSCDTNDVKETVDQILKVQEYGADMVRLTVQSPREAKSSALIKEKLVSLNCDIPLIADIHFNPKVAMMSAEIYDKVRVNPGNYVDGRKNWDEKVYDSYEEFKKSGEYIEEMFTPLVERCKQLKKAIRIGTNHGSLSSRVMSFYGDTPLGMVMSALEFAEICRKNDFHDFVFSMKSSNVFVMIHAYRLLVNEMYKRGWDYPIHLGVTEAGSVDDGRIKSCLGIGSLLIDGIGDTIRMSLTEDPWFELLPSRKLLESIRELYPEKGKETSEERLEYDKWRDFKNIERRNVKYGTSILNYNDEHKNNLLNPNGSVGTILNTHHLNNRIELYKSLGLDIVNGLPNKSLKSVDFVILEDVPYFHEYNKQRVIKELIEGGVNVISPINKLKYNPIKFTIGLVTIKEYYLLLKNTGNKFYNDEKNKNDVNNRLMGINLNEESEKGVEDNNEEELELGKLMNELNKFEKLVVKITGNETDDELLEFFKTYQKYENQPFNKDKRNELGFIILDIDSKLNYMYTVRRIFGLINKANCNLPVIHQLKFPNLEDQQDMLIKSCCLLGCNLIDKMGEGIIIKSKLPIHITNQLSLNILQNSRMRNIKTDFISCPSCGRTLFNIQETTEEIRKKVGHLPGVTIAIMGCIVNGIGEMADADFGYVGGSPGKVDLYVKKKLIERNIPKEQACDKLIELIKQHNKWVEPPESLNAHE